MRYLFLCALLWLSPLAGHAQNANPYMERARTGLDRSLSKIAQWQVTHVTDQTVMQCTSCPRPITVVLRVIPDYTKGTEYSQPSDLYLAGRVLHCQELVSAGAGRCVNIDDNSAADLRPSISAHSIEGDRNVFEFVMPLGPDLLAGYVEGHQDAKELGAVQAALIDGVRRLHPAW